MSTAKSECAPRVEPKLWAAAPKSDRITAAEALGYIVQTHDTEQLFEKETSEFTDFWGFDPSWEDLSKSNRRYIIERVLSAGPPRAHPRTLLRELIRQEGFQRDRSEVWNQAASEVLRWIIDGEIVAEGQPAFFDRRICDPAKAVVPIPRGEAQRSNTRLVAVTRTDVTASKEEYWLVSNYLDFFAEVPFEVYAAERQCWGNVTVPWEDVFRLLGIATQCGTAASTLSPAAYRTGAPGRPSPAHLIEAEFQKREAAGKICPTLAAEVKYLVDWLKQNHPNSPPLKPTSAANSLRKAYREAKATKTH